MSSASSSSNPSPSATSSSFSSASTMNPQEECKADYSSPATPVRSALPTATPEPPRAYLGSPSEKRTHEDLVATATFSPSHALSVGSTGSRGSVGSAESAAASPVSASQGSVSEVAVTLPDGSIQIKRFKRSRHRSLRESRAQDQEASSSSSSSSSTAASSTPGAASAMHDGTSVSSTAAPSPSAGTPHSSSTPAAGVPAAAKKVWKRYSSQVVPPDSFDEAKHFYPRVLNAHLHPMVAAFLRLGNLRIASRYCHLNPKVDEKRLLQLLNQGSQLFRWSGADLFNVTNAAGNRQMIIIETNSSPSGQKSMPLPGDSEDTCDGYHRLMQHCFFPTVREREAQGTLPQGGLAVIYDKNEMEALGYAAAMANIGHEPVHACLFYADDPDPPVRWERGVMHVRVRKSVPPPLPGAETAEVQQDAPANKDSNGAIPSPDASASAASSSSSSSASSSASTSSSSPSTSSATSSTTTSSSSSLSSSSTPASTALALAAATSPTLAPQSSPDQETWVPIRAAFRYVTQRPWSRIPLSSLTLIVNPVVACLAGGRNKMAADKAYEFFNKEVVGSGLAVRTPETIRDVSKDEVPLWVRSMGGKAVVKVPYSNAGQGVYTIINDEELQRFMSLRSRYDKYIVQALVGHGAWSSTTHKGTYFHTGTVPNAKNKTFVADLRMMVCSTPQGYIPLAVYARRAAMPLLADISSAKDSWEMLGTNLSIKNEDGTWDTETNRLLLMDSKDFNRLGLGTDDLIDAYVQTVLATTAIDRLACRLRTNGKFDFDLFSSLNADEALLDEILL